MNTNLEIERSTPRTTTLNSEPQPQRKGRARFLGLILAGFLGVSCAIPTGVNVPVVTPAAASEGSKVTPKMLIAGDPGIGISLQATCNPDGSMNLLLKVDEAKLRLAAPDNQKVGTDDSWTVITNVNTGERAIVEASQGRMVGSWSAFFPGSVGSIRPGGKYSERGLELTSGQPYEVSFFKGPPYTLDQPTLGDPIAGVSFYLSCQ